MLLSVYILVFFIQKKFSILKGQTRNIKKKSHFNCYYLNTRKGSEERGYSPVGVKRKGPRIREESLGSNENTGFFNEVKQLPTHDS